MIQITQTKVDIAAAGLLKQLHSDFARQGCVVLPGLLAPGVLAQVLKRIESASFYRNVVRDHEKHEFASDLTLKENEMALHLIHLLFNNRNLFRAIQAITHCDEIGSFEGRIYRSQPGGDHHLGWHDDTDRRQRIVGISINLSAEPYQGGLFQLRQKESRRIICEVGASKPGDGHMFRISPRLEHRVTAVDGTVARTAAAGWFVSEPDCRTALERLRSRSRITDNPLP